MEQEILSKLMQYLEAAEGMGAFAWQAALRQTTIEAIWFFGLTIIFLALLGSFSYGCWWATREAREDEDVFTAGIFMGFMTVVAAVFAWHWLTIAVGHLVNPGYYAIKILLELVPVP